MSVWAIATAALLPALGLAVLAALRGDLGQRFAAVQVASSIAVLALVLLTFATDQPSNTDLALTLVLLGLPGTLLFSLFLERWL
ncbi:monovalent cation/H+ antiporter complex subunit F [Methylobacterium sp. JK268]